MKYMYILHHTTRTSCILAINIKNTKEEKKTHRTQNSLFSLPSYVYMRFDAAYI